MDDDVKPANAHIALNVIDRRGRHRAQDRAAQHAVRRDRKGEFGTYFIGYSRTAAVTEKMLSNMFIGDPPGNTDHILEFSTAITGGKFFTPIVDFLNDPPPLPQFGSQKKTSHPSPASLPATARCASAA